jgi:hypothetical protein
MTDCEQGAVRCGSTTDVHLYVIGRACPRHTPAAQGGRPEPPDPATSPPLTPTERKARAQ